MKQPKGRLLILFITIAVNNNSFCQASYDSATKEYFYGDLNKSIQLFTKSIENKDEIAKSYMYRAAAKSFLSRFVEAKIDLDSSLKLDPSNKKINYYYGKFYLFQKKYKEAFDYYTISITKSPKDAAAYDERAVARSFLGDFAGTIADEDIAIKIDSTEQIYYTDRGFAKLKLDQYDAAIKDFDMSIKIAPNQKAYANRGLAYALLGLHVKAIEDYSRSLSINSIDYLIYYYRGKSYQAIGKIEKACDDFRKSKELGYLLAEKALKEIKCN